MHNVQPNIFLIVAKTRIFNKAAEEDVIRIATSPMASVQALTDAWSDIHRLCPDLKFQMVSHKNTVEQVDHILSNLGETVDLVVGYYDENCPRCRKCQVLLRSNETAYSASAKHPRFGDNRIRPEAGGERSTQKVDIPSGRYTCIRGAGCRSTPESGTWRAELLPMIC